MVKQIVGASLIVGALFTGTALAQTRATDDQQRDVNQQSRIEQGLQSGQLSTKEAGQLERGQQAIDRQEAKDLKNGSISASEQAKLNSMQNKESNAIYNDKHNAVKGNPNSASSQRMQADVQRNVNQQERINNGMRNGSLTNKEAGSLERGQAHVDRKEANAAANGHVSAGEQARIQGSENHQSNRIYNKKHNGVTK
ncbi:MAG: hypothetical protein JSS29_18435 [Proteobacteria bacterium]|nr:hypothetical protein [Pseudomonadota bacterium]